MEGLTRPDQLIKNEDGRATIKLADAQYDEVDTKTTTTSMRGSTIASNEDITLIATAGSVNIIGSTLTADADNNNSGTLGLAGATGVNITEATETYETQTKEVHGSAELSFVVQHQAAEVVKAVIAVDEAKDKLEQAKKDYNAYERNVSQLEDQLSQLENDYANKVPGVSYDDLLELRELVGDVKEDKEWYQAGIALAAVNLTSATTALVQQTAAAAASSGTWGFNAGLQLDVDASKSNTKEQGTVAVASNLSGNNIVIQTGTANTDGSLNTKGTSTTISGSHLNASDKISIQTGDLNLLASKNTYERQSEQEQGHVTAQMTVYGASGGASITGSFDRSKDSERSTTHNNSTLTANTIDLFTSGDANIRGANVHANQHLETDIQGNLNLESVQDRSNSRNTSIGVSGGFSLGGDGKTNDGNAFTKNIQSAGDIGGVSGVNAGVSTGNGMSVTRETVLTSLTSGGTANVNVKGSTQITGALLATIDDEGNDLNNLNLSTGSLNYTDLRNISQNTQTNAGVSTNLGVGDNKGENPLATQTTAEGANGDNLIKGTSNLVYSKTNENSASKTLATLGHGNISVGGVPLEKDGELTEAGKANGSPLIGMNRDTTSTEKELWNSEQSQTVDAMLDHRILTSGGWSKIGEDWEVTKEGAKAAVDKTVDVLDDTRIAVKEFLGIDSELSAEQSAALSFQLADSNSRTQPSRDLSLFSADDQALIQQLEVLKQQYSASDSSTEGAIYWETVIDMAYDPGYGPRKAIMALDTEVGRKDFDYIGNIDLLRHEVEIVKEDLANTEATIGQAGNIAYGGSMFLRAGQAIVESFDAGLDSAKRLIKETDNLTGSTNDVVPNRDNIAGDVRETAPPIKVEIDGEMIGQPEIPLELPKFTTNGKLINEPETIPVGQEMIAEYMKMGASYEKAIEYTKGAIVSGSDIPVTKIIEEPLYKVVPKGTEVSDYTVFWMSRSELDRLIENPDQFAKNSGLPLQSNAVVYDVYKITPKEPAKVFESKIADTQQGDFKQEANATQTLVPNRKQFTEPEKVFEFGGNK